MLVCDFIKRRKCGRRAFKSDQVSSSRSNRRIVGSVVQDEKSNRIGRTEEVGNDRKARISLVPAMIPAGRRSAKTRSQQRKALVHNVELKPTALRSRSVNQPEEKQPFPYECDEKHAQGCQTNLT